MLVVQIKGPFILNVGRMGGVECVWVRNVFRQICMGTNYFQNFLYRYEIIFTNWSKIVGSRSISGIH